MTELLDQETPDSEDFMVSWLQPLLRSATERKTDDELPFAQVQLITGEDDEDCGTSDEVIQVDWFDHARDGMTAVQAAKQTAREGHRRIRLLARFLEAVELSDGSFAAADYVNTIMKPVRMPYANDQVVRYVARYGLGLSDVPVTP